MEEAWEQGYSLPTVYTMAFCVCNTTGVYIPRNLGICTISRLRLHSQNPEIAFQSRDCATIVRNLQIAQVTYAHYS